MNEKKTKTDIEKKERRDKKMTERGREENRRSKHNYSLFHITSNYPSPMPANYVAAPFANINSVITIDV